ncbi:hypothetical protein [Ulvibacter antarcticus]|uniref:Uncharacterized protein n=1 Tax=Ulvibacter antarcticus TaxID=442714 RepID=A0A3L9Z494_9FLAO|nr:hypothetical protein [Ulvibacter antarcticus]RMA67693.1 hypothetical protein BXY75_0003 [Ulvibacter antarcticus]
MKPTFIRELAGWELYLNFDGEYLVKTPDNEIVKFLIKQKAETYILYKFYSSF